MTETPIKIRLTGKVGYEDEITASQAAEIIAFLNAEVVAKDNCRDLILFEVQGDSEYRLAAARLRRELQQFG